MRGPFIPGFPSTSRKRRWLLLVAVPAFAFGCANEPVGPQREVAAPLFDGKAKGKDDDGTVFVFAGQTCPAGEFVTGFDDSGQIICAAPGGEPPQVPENTPPTLESVQITQVNDYEYTCEAAGVYDADGDAVSIAYEWDWGQGIIAGNTLDLSLTPLPSGTEVFCVVTLFDGTDSIIDSSGPLFIP
jgi:hypothetical protein